MASVETDMVMPAEIPAVPEGKKKIEQLSRILRVIGALALIASASTYLFQQWGDSGIQRYLILLAQTLVISGAGFFCGLGIKESKGARTLLGLTLAVMPIHFAVLGGLIYSQFALDPIPDGIPVFATWVASSPTAALLTATGAVVLLTGLAYISYLALARNHARLLTVGFMAVNATILIPYRNPDIIAALIAVHAILLVLFELKIGTRATALQTLEGRVVRILNVAPMAILIGRAFQLYEITPWFLGAAAFATSLWLFALPPGKNPETKQTVQGFSVVPAALAWQMCFYALDPDPPLKYLGPIFVLPFCGLLMFMSLRVLGSGNYYRRAAAGLAIFTVTVNLMIFPGLGTALICLAVSMASVIYGFLNERRLIFLGGLFGVAVALIHHLRQALDIWSLGSWSSLAVIGILIVLAASLLERNHQALIQWTVKIRQQVASWEN